MPAQTILSPEDDYRQLDETLADLGVKRLLLVCDASLPFLRIAAHLEALPERTGIRVVPFRDFAPNPGIESAAAGVRTLRAAGCDAVMAVGGGSAMDVAKCVKLFSGMDLSGDLLGQEIAPNSLPLIAMPTTAGTGSEATRYAVVYRDGEKQSVTHDSILPAWVLMDPSALETLPLYQKKSTMMDALCHAVESWWSVHSTPESQAFSAAAIRGIFAHAAGYLANDPAGNREMLLAANLAGKAINITQTTAGHAMCYKLTTRYGLAHGHAAALCCRALFPWTAAHADRCIDPRGEGYLRRSLAGLAEAMGCERAGEAAEKFADFVDRLGLAAPAAGAEDVPLLADSVNPVRLKNHPVRLERADMEALYRQILKGDGKA